MNYVELKLQFADSASLRLLRADNAPLLLAVLFAAFKHEHSSAVPESRLRAILEAELEELRDAGETVADKKAKDYLLEWSDQAHGYLRRHQPDGMDEPGVNLENLVANASGSSALTYNDSGIYATVGASFQTPGGQRTNTNRLRPSSTPPATTSRSPTTRRNGARPSRTKSRRPPSSSRMQRPMPRCRSCMAF